MLGTRESNPVASPAQKVLLITYAYPPSNTPGVFRIIGFVNYLNEFNFDPIVLTAKNPTDHEHDPELCTFVRREVSVHRVWGIDLKKMAVGLKRAITRPFRSAPDEVEADNASRALSPLPSTGSFKKIFSRLLEFPDTRIGWVPFSLVKAHRLISKNSISHILTSSPPHSIQLVGLLLKLLHPKCVWVSDYRDPWTDNLVIRAELPPMLDKFERWIERTAHKHSDIIVANTSTNRDILLRNNPFLSPSKVVVIPNGTDPNDFAELVPIRAKNGRDSLQCVFVGSLYNGMIDSLLATLLVLKEKDSSSLAKMYFHFIGYADASDRYKVESYGLADSVSFRGVVSYKESLQYMLGADLLLYLLPAGEAMGHWIPSKLYNYLLAGRPILAIIPEGDAAGIIRKFGAGTFFDPRQKEETAAFLRTAVESRGTGEIRAKVDMELIRPFERRHLVEELAKIMDAAGKGDLLVSRHIPTQEFGRRN